MKTNKKKNKKKQKQMNDEWAKKEKLQLLFNNF